MRGRQRALSLHSLLVWLLVGCVASRLPLDAEEELAHDLEAPGVLEAAARALATAHNEVVFVVMGPDATSMQMANNSLVTLAGVGLCRAVLRRTSRCLRTVRTCHAYPLPVCCA